MKQYGFNKATEFSRKQINVIFALAKSKQLKVEKWVISDFYDLADFYGMDFNGSIEYHERYILNILNSVFDKKYEEAQARIDRCTEAFFNAYTKKAQLALNREYV